MQLIRGTSVLALLGAMMANSVHGTIILGNDDTFARTPYIPLG